MRGSGWVATLFYAAIGAGVAAPFDVAALQLEALWDEAIAAATQDNSFDTLCSYLEKVRLRGLPTCFDQNSSKSTNFSASRLSKSTAQRDLAVGAKRRSKEQQE